MKKKNKILIATAAAAVIIAGVFLIFFDRIAISVLSASFDSDIRFKYMRNIHFTEYLFDDLEVTYRKKGTGILARSANITPGFTKNFPRSIAFGFLLKDINFIGKDGNDEAKYNTLSSLMSLPFMSRWLYPDVTGRIECFTDRITVHDFTASSSDIRVSFKGDVFYDKKVKGEIKIDFSGDVLEKIPDDLTGMLLSDEGEGWKSISVKLDGDYAAPSVQLTGKMFRLSIKNVSAK